MTAIQRAGASGQRRPRVLYICARAPYPLHSGTAIRQFHLLRAYAAFSDVTLACIDDDAQEDKDRLTELASHCTNINFVGADTTYFRTTYQTMSWFRRRLLQVTCAKPLSVILGHSRALESIVTHYAAHADLIHVARLAMASHIDPIMRMRSRPRLVLDLDDVETIGRLRELTTMSNRPLKTSLLAWIDLARLAFYQRKSLQSFDRVLVCSEADRSRLPNTTILVVPNGTTIVDANASCPRDQHTILFCGSLSYAPNVDAILHFTKSIFPHILRDVPEAKLLIVGRSPSTDVIALGKQAHVTVHSNVSSVYAYYQRAAIAVAPIRMGAGTRLKILEAFAFDTPVVSTSRGCEGLTVENGKHLLVADEPGAFAEHCIRLLHSSELRAGFARRARALVTEKYLWASIRSAFANEIREMLAD